LLNGKSATARHSDLQQFRKKVMLTPISRGLDGYLAEKDFIPLDDQGRNSARDSALSLTPITRFLTHIYCPIEKGRPF
jgi:hypothetical protein